MRFHCNPEAQSLTWQWYDNDSSHYRSFTEDWEKKESEQKDRDEHKENDNDAKDILIDAIAELEACFLANVKENFPTAEFRYKFKTAKLLKVQRFFDYVYGTQRLYSFRCILSKEKDIILTMEKIAYNTHTKTVFPRHIRRMVHDENSINFVRRNSSMFAKVFYKMFRSLRHSNNQPSMIIYTEMEVEIWFIYRGMYF